jgi:hypothetical protein
MNKLIGRLCVIMVALCAQLAFAQATRTWVSGVGDDVNPCSRTAPCKTFAGAISKTGAGGEINALDSGGFGAVTITKAMTIDGTATLAGILVAGTNAVIVNAGIDDDVIIRNVVFSGLGTGLAAVRILQARSVTLENLSINGFSGNAVEVVTTQSTRLLVRNVRITGASGVVAGKAGVSLVNTGVSTKTIAALENVTVSGYPVGIDIGAQSTAHVDRSNFFGNGIGVKAAVATALVRLSDTTVTANTTGLSTTATPPDLPGQIVSYNNNRLRGNTTDGAPSSVIYTR